MVYLDPMWQNVIFAVFGMIWFTGEAVLYIRTYIKQRAYLRRFANEYPYLAGEPLFDVPRTFSAFRTIRRLCSTRQDDPELERDRREMRRRNRQMTYWIFGFPVMFIGLMAFLIITHAIRLLP